MHGSPHSSTSFARHAHSISSSSVRSVIPTRFSGATPRFPSSYSRWSTSRRGVPSASWPPDYRSQHNSSIESSTYMIFPCIVGYPVTGMRFSFGFRHASAARRLALAPCTPAIPNEPNPKIGHSEAGGRATTLRIRATPRNSRFAFRSLAWESSTGVRVAAYCLMTNSTSSPDRNLGNHV